MNIYEVRGLGTMLQKRFFRLFGKDPSMLICLLWVCADIEVEPWP